MVINSVKEQFVKLNLIERRELLDELLRLQELDGLSCKKLLLKLKSKEI
jgi:hypothetical protein